MCVCALVFLPFPFVVTVCSQAQLPRFAASRNIMQCEVVMCLRLSGRAPWVPVPVTTEGVTECVRLCSTRAPWALTVIRPHGQNKRDPHECCLVLRTFEAEVRATLTTSDVSDDSQSSSPTPTKLRLCDSESEDELCRKRPCSKSAGGDRPASSPPAKKRKALRSSVGSIGFASSKLGDEIVRMGVGKGPGLLLYADTANILNVMKYIQDNFDRLAEAGRSMNLDKSAAERDAPEIINVEASGMQPELQKKKKVKQGVDAGKVRFDFKTGGYTIHYVDENDKPHRLAAGFVVPRACPRGVTLNGEDYALAKQAVLQKARKRWNELDSSDAGRYP